MGADFLLYMMPSAKPTDERKQAVTDWLNQMTLTAEGDLKSLLDMGELEYIVTDSEFDSDGVLNSEGAEELRDHTLSRMSEYWDLWDEGLPRDTTTVVSDARNYYVTGGMSWGDIPSDTSELVHYIGNFSGLWDLLQSWALEDAVADCRDSVTTLTDELVDALGGPSG